MLDKAKIEYTTVTYEVDESDLSGTHIAECTGLDPETVFKTLVTKGDKTGFCVFCMADWNGFCCREILRNSVENADGAFKGIQWNDEAGQYDQPQGVLQQGTDVTLKKSAGCDHDQDERA